MVITLHFSGWNAIFQVVSHWANLSRSFCNVAASEFDLMAKYAIVSSANRRMVDVRPDGMSFI